MMCLIGCSMVIFSEKEKDLDKCDPTWDLVPLGGNIYFLVDALYFLVVKTIRKYSF